MMALFLWTSYHPPYFVLFIAPSLSDGRRRHGLEQPNDRCCYAVIIVFVTSFPAGKCGAIGLGCSCSMDEQSVVGPA